jgi:putative nucleotidyltransferase with HDIG domain
MVKIRDPIHGTVVLSPLEEALLDTPQMQRLRGIRQLAMACLVYPGANHTRFEHSIGTLFLADRICRELALADKQREKVRAAALLHDIGHVAFSHESELVLAPHIGSHEKIGEGLVKKGGIAEILQKEFQPLEIASLARMPLGQIISSDIGADRMDYLLRDSHYTGVAYGVVDAERICASLSLAKSGLRLEEKGLAAAESLLVARFSMFTSVYLHKTVRIASRMLQEAVFIAVGEGAFEPKEALALGDAQMLSALCASPSAAAYVKRLSERRLFKKAYSFPVPKRKEDAAELAAEISGKCGCIVLADVPSLSAGAKIALVSEGGAVEPLARASELVASLERMQEGRLDAMLMCDERDVAKVGRLRRGWLADFQGEGRAPARQRWRRKG